MLQRLLYKVLYTSHLKHINLNTNRTLLNVYALSVSRTFSSVTMDKYVTKTPRSQTESTPNKDEKKYIKTSPVSTRVTRSVHNEAVISDRDKFLSMPLEEKRSHYKCGKKYTTLEKVPTWPQYYAENEKRITSTFLKKRLVAKYEANEKLNECVCIWRGDITTLEIDAITNAANNSLLGGGGVDGAIHNAAGKKLVQECMTLNGCDTGDAKITGGYKLPAKYVIHTVGPIGEYAGPLTDAYSNVLKRVAENNLKSVAIPCISTGIYGYPNEKAAKVALKTVRKFLEKDDMYEKIDRVIFCLFLPKDVAVYEEQMQVYFPFVKPLDKSDEDIDMETASSVSEKGKNEKEKTDHKTKDKKMEMSRNNTKEEKMDTNEGDKSEILTEEGTENEKVAPNTGEIGEKMDTVGIESEKKTDNIERSEKDRKDVKMEEDNSEQEKKTKTDVTKKVQSKKNNNEINKESKTPKENDISSPENSRITRKTMKESEVREAGPKAKKLAFPHSTKL